MIVASCLRYLQAAELQDRALVRGWEWCDVVWCDVMWCERIILEDSLLPICHQWNGKQHILVWNASNSIMHENTETGAITALWRRPVGNYRAFEPLRSCGLRSVGSARHTDAPKYALFAVTEKWERRTLRCRRAASIHADLSVLGKSNTHTRTHTLRSLHTCT